MAVPNDHNNQNNYDMFQSSPMNPDEHEIDNIPDASIQHDGTQLPTAGSPQPQAQQAKPGDNANRGMQALEELKKHMQSGTTKTKGKKK